MLKLPMGCALEGAGNRASAAATARKWRTIRVLASTRSLMLADNDFLLRQPGQCLGGLFGIENVEVRIGRERLSQIAFCLGRIAYSFVDDPGVKEKLRVSCSLAKSVRDRVSSVLKPTVLV